MIFSAVNVALNIGLSFYLFFQWQIAGTTVGLGMGLLGIAIATSTAAWVNTLLLVGRLRQLDHLTFDDRTRARLPRILVASLGMGLVLWFGQQQTAGLMNGTHWEQILALAILVGAGLASFALLVQLTGGAKVSELRAAFRKS